MSKSKIFLFLLVTFIITVVSFYQVKYSKIREEAVLRYEKSTLDASESTKEVARVIEYIEKDFFLKESTNKIVGIFYNEDPYRNITLVLENGYILKTSKEAFLGNGDNFDLNQWVQNKNYRDKLFRIDVSRSNLSVYTPTMYFCDSYPDNNRKYLDELRKKFNVAKNTYSEKICGEIIADRIIVVE